MSKNNNNKNTQNQNQTTPASEPAQAEMFASTQADAPATTQPAAEAPTTKKKNPVLKQASGKPGVPYETLKGNIRVDN